MWQVWGKNTANCIVWQGTGEETIMNLKDGEMEVCYQVLLEGEEHVAERVEKEKTQNLVAS